MVDGRGMCVCMCLNESFVSFDNWHKTNFYSIRIAVWLSWANDDADDDVSFRIQS